MAIHLNHLNTHQRDAVIYGSGPLLILAGAGSGKTSTMAHRIAYLIAQRHVPASAILGLSFTNKAAGELKERVGKLVVASSGKRATRGMTITTFHSLCAKLLRNYAASLGFQTNFTILDQNDQLDVLKQVLRNIKIDDRRFDPGLLLFEFGQAKNRFLRSQEAEAFFLESGRLPSDYAIAAASSFSRYQDQLRILNAMDFDDLIYYTVELLEKHEDVRDACNYRFRHILVDEYQDTNAAQFKILNLLTQKQQNLCVVGDDDQSIYAWRGADPSHILNFKKYFPEAHTITLDQNYRSTGRILEAANCVIAKNENRFPKRLWSDRGEGESLNFVILEEDRAEADYVGDEIVRRATEQTRPWKDFAILYRSNSQSRVFEEALRRRGVPYKIVGGLSFLARKEVKDVLSYWKLVVNPKDDASLRRVINWPARGIGKTSIEKLSAYAFENKISLFEALSKAAELAPKSATAISSFRSMVEDLQAQLKSISSDAQGGVDSRRIVEWAQGSLNRVQARRGIEEDCDDPVQAAKRWENVEELIHSIGQFRFGPVDHVEAPADASSTAAAQTQSDPFEGETNERLSGVDYLKEFLVKMTLDAQEAEKDEERNEDLQKNQVTLLTLHGAKGLEYPVVFMVGMEDGFLPHRRTIEEAVDFSEERRLCYVGITRARDHLILTRVKNRIRYGKPLPRIQCRFLDEIPKDLLVCSDQSGSPDLTSKESVLAHEKKVKNFLDEIRGNLLKKKV